MTGDRGPRRSYRAVTLDLFGTLLDFQSILRSTLHRILVDNDLVHRSTLLQERMRSFTFEGTDKGGFITVREDFERTLAGLLEELGVDGDNRSYSADVLGGMFEQVRRADLYPEVLPVLESFEGAGVPWGIVSNVDEDDLWSIVRNHHLRPAVAVSSERVASYKPNPRIFEVALSELGVGVDGTLHAGDSPFADVMGAGSAGIDTLWVNRFGNEFPPDLPRPNYESSDLTTLPELVDHR